MQQKSGREPPTATRVSGGASSGFVPVSTVEMEAAECRRRVTKDKRLRLTIFEGQFRV